MGMITDEMREAAKRAMWTEGKAPAADRGAYEDRGPGADKVLTKLADDAIATIAPMILAQERERCASVAKALFTPTHVDIAVHEPVQVLTLIGGPEAHGKTAIQYPDGKVRIMSTEEFEQTYVYVRGGQ